MADDQQTEGRKANGAAPAAGRAPTRAEARESNLRTSSAAQSILGKKGAKSKA